MFKQCLKDKISPVHVDDRGTAIRGASLGRCKVVIVVGNEDKVSPSKHDHSRFVSVPQFLTIDPLNLVCGTED